MTKTFDFPEARGVVVSGDIHGEFNQLVFKCCVQYSLRDTLIIVAGDCGFGFERPGYYEQVYHRNRQRLASANNWLLMVRGNHDNPAYFNLQPIAHERFMTAPDYSVVRACGHSILCVGGAISVDRSLRIASDRYHLSKADDPLAPNVYWRNEAPDFDEAALDHISEHCAIDTVVSHTAPSFCELISKNGLMSWAMADEDLPEHVKAERRTMDQLHRYLTSRHHPLSRWFYGHFHQSWHQQVDGILFDMLDIMELRELN